MDDRTLDTVLRLADACEAFALNGRSAVCDKRVAPPPRDDEDGEPADE